MENRDKDEIIKLLKDFYTGKFYLKTKLALNEPNGSEKLEYLTQFKGILPTKIEQNITLEILWNNETTKTITIDYILESRFNYVLIFLDETRGYTKSKYEEMRKFAIAHKRSINQDFNNFGKEYVYIYYGYYGYCLIEENEQSLSLWYDNQPK